MSRAFSEKQRIDMLQRQEGRCAWCGKRLDLAEAEGDHRQQPWVRGGPTETWNGQLVHSTCHDRKEALTRSLRDWQREFIYALDDHSEQTFLLAAPVGSGKTRGSVAGFNLLRRQTLDALCIVVSPSIQIIRGWASEATTYGKVGVKNLDPSERVIVNSKGDERELLQVNNDPPRDLLFWLMTYSSLGNLSGKLHALCRNRSVLVILDEIHHASSREDKAWGEYVGYAFQDAQKILCITATPNRTDRQRVSYINYDEVGQPLPDYELDLRRAINDKLIVPTEFLHMDGEGSWRRITADDEIEGRGLISDEQTSDAALNAAIQDSAYQDECIRQGHQLLAYKRQHQFPNATCLVFAQRNEVAGEIARRLNREVPGSAVVATSDTPDAHRTIDDFRNRRISATTLVACGMASEGCDIPHVKVTVNLQNRRSYVDFIQRVVGRGSRSVGLDVTHSVVLPAHPELHRLAVGLLDHQGEPLLESEVGYDDQEAIEREASTFIVDGVEDIHPLWYSTPAGSGTIDDEAAAIAASEDLPVQFVQQVLEAQRRPPAERVNEAVVTEDVDHNKRTLELRASCVQVHKRIAMNEAPGNRYHRQWSEIWTEGHRRARVGMPKSGIRKLESLDDSELERLLPALLALEDEVCR